MATKLPAVLQHYHASSPLPDGDLKVNCKYCVKEITGSVKSTTNWWKQLSFILRYTHIH